MCLIVLAREVHPDYPLILLAHRDEFTHRPALPLDWWPDGATLAGRDLAAGGTWLGAHRNGRFGAVTNVREGLPQASARSRGELLPDWLNSSADSPAAHAALRHGAAQYSGFNLLLGQWRNGQLTLHYLSNRFPARPLGAGVVALSNGALDADWPKARLAKERLQARLASGATPEETWLDDLADRTIAPDAALPDTGIGLDKERWLSPLLITGPHYGSRAASLLTLRRDGLLILQERTLDPARDGAIVDRRRAEIRLV